MTEGEGGGGGDFPSVSIIVNTDGRAAGLAITLASLRYLRYPAFEVVVVTGPTSDDTPLILNSWRSTIKIGHCPERNLSRSRNIGIELSSGQIIAFLDDDAVPEPEWLAGIVGAFRRDRRVGAAGGFLHDHTGKAYQWSFGTVNRLGNANTNWSGAAPQHNFPLSYSFPSLMGANCAFHRDALQDVGGFDEEYDYYLDESDLICRIVDAGWHIAQLDNAFVHHKFMASTIRTHQRVLKSHYAVLKNKLYFMLMNARLHVKVTDMISEMQSFVSRHRGDVVWCIDQGLLPTDALKRFEVEQEKAWSDGLQRGMRGERQLPATDRLTRQKDSFFPLRPLRQPEAQRCFVFSTAEYPPNTVGGIGRYVHQLARTIARLGHQVHVLTKTQSHDRVDFEDDVWVHRIVVREQKAARPGEFVGIPQHIWNYSKTMLDEMREIATRRAVDCAVTPIWDIEGIAFETEPSIPHVVSLHTTLRSYLDSNPHMACDVQFMQEFGGPMLEGERRLLTGAGMLLANSNAIVDEIQRAYDLTLPTGRHAIIPHGIDDWSQSNSELPSRLPDGDVRIVFVGRLEPRKGVDVLLQIAPAFLQRHPHVWLDFVGNDKVEGPGGRTWRSVYEGSWPPGDWQKRVSFHGEVSDERLRGFYETADVVVAPSRFESFGLVHLEAMMYGKPIVGCRAGGTAELIEDGVTGLLAEPGDTFSLVQCLERLVTHHALRMDLGTAARNAYVERYTATAMAHAVVLALSRVADAARAERTGAEDCIAPS